MVGGNGFAFVLPLFRVILGCTELPVLYQHVRKEAKEGGVKVYDPLEEVIGMLKEKKNFYCIKE